MWRRYCFSLGPISNDVWDARTAYRPTARREYIWVLNNRWTRKTYQMTSQTNHEISPNGFGRYRRESKIEFLYQPSQFLASFTIRFETELERHRICQIDFLQRAWFLHHHCEWSMELCQYYYYVQFSAHAFVHSAIQLTFMEQQSFIRASADYHRQIFTPSVSRQQFWIFCQKTLFAFVRLNHRSECEEHISLSIL